MAITYKTEQWVPYPVELVFAFFANPYNLPLLMPKALKVRIEEAALAPPPPRPVPDDQKLRFKSIAAGEGSQFIVSACILPLPLVNFRIPWEAKIIEFQWNHHFTDEQLRGPFVEWRHTHSVRPEMRNGEAGTVVTDSVACEPPVAGVSSPFVKAILARSFRQRQRKLDLILPKLVASLSQRVTS